MSVKVIVSSEELKKTMELLALISAPAGKKKDEDAKQMFNTMRITAVCPHRDKNYMLIFGKAGNGEQLTYRMEGKSTVSTESADMYIDCKRFMAMAKTCSGDVALTFESKELKINVAGSEYNLTALNAELPEIKVPQNGSCLINTQFMYEAARFCSVAIAKDAAGIRGCVQIKIAADSSAVCYGAQSSCAAKYVVPSTGCYQETVLQLLPLHLQHIAELAEGAEVRLVRDAKDIIFVTAPRFDYLCYPLSGQFFACDRIFNKPAIKHITVNKSRLMAALARAAVIAGDTAEEATSKVRICSDTENIYLSTASVAGNGIEIIPLDSMEGDENESENYLPVNRLVRIISNLSGDAVTISTKGKLDQLYIRSSGSDSAYLVAPMRG